MGSRNDRRDSPAHCHYALVIVEVRLIASVVMLGLALVASVPSEIVQ